MQEVLGRPLARREHVHHLDHDRANNNPANLLVLSHAEHTRSHCELRPLVAFCRLCGRPFICGLHDGFHAGTTYCSRRCSRRSRVPHYAARLADLASAVPTPAEALALALGLPTALPAPQPAQIPALL